MHSVSRFYCISGGTIRFLNFLYVSYIDELSINYVKMKLNIIFNVIETKNIQEKKIKPMCLISLTPF